MPGCSVLHPADNLPALIVTMCDSIDLDTGEAFESRATIADLGEALQERIADFRSDIFPGRELLNTGETAALRIERVL